MFVCVFVCRDQMKIVQNRRAHQNTSNGLRLLSSFCLFSVNEMSEVFACSMSEVQLLYRKKHDLTRGSFSMRAHCPHSAKRQSMSVFLEYAHRNATWKFNAKRKWNEKFSEKFDVNVIFCTPLNYFHLVINWNGFFLPRSFYHSVHLWKGQ